MIKLPNPGNSRNPLRRTRAFNRIQQFSHGSRLATAKRLDVSWIVGALLMCAAMLPSTAMGATMRVEIHIAAPVDEVWAAVRDVGAVHTRLAPGFVVDDRLEKGVRTVTFADGFVVKETIVSIDDENHRLGYSAAGRPSTFHFASIQVVADGEASRLIWITDVLPDDRKGPIMALMEQGAMVMKKTLEEAAARVRH